MNKPLTEEKIAQAARYFVNARQCGQKMTALPEECAPRTNEEGFAIQQRVGCLLAASIGGWKCALPTPEKMIVAPIYESTIRRSSPCTLPFQTELLRVEPEIACVLGSDLLPRKTAYEEADLLAAIDTAHLALELIDCRYQNPEQVAFPGHIADGIFNGGLILGPQIPKDLGVRAATFPFTRFEQGNSIAVHEGKHPDGGPLAPMVWLVNFLSAHGIALTRGQALISGSYAGVFSVPFDTALSFQFGDLGCLPMQFQACV